MKLMMIVMMSLFVLLHLLSDTGHGHVDDGVVDNVQLDVPDDRSMRILTGRNKNSEAGEDNFVNIDEKVEQEDQVASIHHQYLSYFKDLREPSFTKPENVHPKKGFIDIGFILINLKKTDKFDYSMRFKVTRTLESMMTYSSGDPLHFIILTDSVSISIVGRFLAHFISRRLSQGVIIESSWRKSFLKGVPRLKFSFVKVSDVKSVNEPFVEALKANSEEKADEKVDKYSADLFYIAPLYYKAFSSLNKLIFIDITDLEFFSNIRELYQEFYKMSPDQVMGVGLELTPHYRKFLGKQYLDLHPDTDLGLPGPKQGLNTGVVLFRLDKMRSSDLFTDNVEAEAADQLIKRFMFNMTVGDQDWFTDLCWQHPSLFYILPCQFNTQTSLQYLRPPWEHQFDSYHHCDEKKNIKIVHRNGCGPKPQACGYNPEPDSEYWADKKNHYYDIHLNVEFFWEFMRESTVVDDESRNKVEMFRSL